MTGTTIGTSFGFRLLPFLLILPFGSPAQAVGKHIRSREQSWIGYFNQTRLSSRLGFWFDIHYRRTGNFVEQPFQMVIRPAVTYYVNDNLRVNVGYTLVEHFPAKGMTTSRTEHRPWQQIGWNQKYARLATHQRLRLEQRFNERIRNDIREPGFDYHFRIRYNFSLFIPLTDRGPTGQTLSLVLNDEIFLNFGERITFNTFDQNRFFSGIAYQLTPDLNMQFGYMYVFHQEFSGNSYLATHALRLFVFHALDLRNKKKVN